MFSPSYAYLPENFPSLLQVLNGESPSQSKAVVVDREPGTEYQYSNAGYTILQQLIIDAGKQSFPTFMSDKIFQPLRMISSTFEQPLPADILAKASAGHAGDGAPLATNGSLIFNRGSKQEDSSVVFHFSDELGRFLNEPQAGHRMGPEEKIPIELLSQGRISEAVDMFRRIIFRCFPLIIINQISADLAVSVTPALQGEWSIFS